MNGSGDAFLTKVLHDAHIDGRRFTGVSEGLPPYLLRQASRRLRVVALIMIGIVAFSWLGSNLVEGELGHELTTPIEWVPNAIILASSFLVVGLVQLRRSSPSVTLRFALAYQVVISWTLPISQYWNAFAGVPVESINGDLVGVSGVALWMIFFTVIVPTRPRYALAALSLSGLAVPTTIAILMRGGNIVAIAPVDFVLIFVIPYVMTVFVAYIAASITYGLGRDVQQAAELGSYRLLEKIGSGGMGEVWRAEHHLLARPAAVKLIHREALTTGPLSLESVLARFEREAQVTASLQSPHTVELYDFGMSDDGSLYYAMELLDGMDLETFVRRFGPLPVARVVHVLRQVCMSLAEAHRRGLVHRDIKPANIFLCKWALEHDFVKVLDFGLVKRVSVMDSGGDVLAATGPQVVLGTPAYLAPELATAEAAVDKRADIYSLGCVAFWLLSGRVPFDEESPLAMIVAHAKTTPQAPSEFADGIPLEIDDLVLRCLAKRPEDRPPTAEAVAQLLEAAGGSPWSHDEAEAWWRSHGAA